MKITLEPARRGEKGYALVITMLFLFVTLITLTGMWLWTSTNGGITQRNNTFNQSAAAAEAATEYVFSTMDRDFLYSSHKTNTAYVSLIPDTSSTNLWPIQYLFSDTNGNTNVVFVSEDQTTGTNLVPLNSQYYGLKGYVQNCSITAVATPKNQLYNVPATVTQIFQAAIIPVFQFAIFYNLNLEMDPGQPQTVSGPVFCNASIWEGNVDLTFDATVQAVGTNCTTSIDPFGKNYGGTNSAAYSGTPKANFTTGLPADKANALTIPIGGGASTNTNPTNVEAILNLPPSGLGAPNTAAYATTNQIYLFNECDLIISNASYGTNGFFNNTNFPTGTSVNTLATNLTIWYQDSKNTPSLKALTNDLIQLKATSGTYSNTITHAIQGNSTNYASTNILYAGWSFVTNVTFIDYRESATVQAVQIDITKLQHMA